MIVCCDTWTESVQVQRLLDVSFGCTRCIPDATFYELVFIIRERRLTINMRVFYLGILIVVSSTQLNNNLPRCSITTCPVTWHKVFDVDCCGYDGWKCLWCYTSVVVGFSTPLLVSQTLNFIILGFVENECS